MSKLLELIGEDPVLELVFPGGTRLSPTFASLAMMLSDCVDDGVARNGKPYVTSELYSAFRDAFMARHGVSLTDTQMIQIYAEIEKFNENVRKKSDR